MSLYESVTDSPELLFAAPAAALALLGLVILLVAWVFFSYRKLFNYYSDIASSVGRWEYFMLPPSEQTGNIFWFLVLVGLNLALIAAGVWAIGLAVYVAV